MYRIIVSICLLLFAVFFSQAQSQQDIFPDKKGSELLSLIVTDYKPSGTLSYNDARNELWGAVAAHNQDSLRCVYTGYTIYISPSAANPRTDAYNNGINCEHTWPQSLGAEGQAKSDMHHLFPTREDVNAARGNLAFSDIDDTKTDKWFWLDQQKTTIPISNINQYSEVDNNSWFEVREDHKGNVARAMIYFYSMYTSQADDNFFNKQLATFYKWHYSDPVDTDEEWRNDFIASKQGGHPNPFIQDSTLIRRAYFPNYKGWNGVDINDGSINFHIYINNNSRSIEINSDINLSNVWLNIYNVYGQCVKSNHFALLNNRTSISTTELVPAFYLLLLRTDNLTLCQKINISN